MYPGLVPWRCRRPLSGDRRHNRFRRFAVVFPGAGALSREVHEDGRTPHYHGKRRLRPLELGERENMASPLTTSPGPRREVS